MYWLETKDGGGDNDPGKRPEGLNVAAATLPGVEYLRHPPAAESCEQFSCPPFPVRQFQAFGLLPERQPFWWDEKWAGRETPQRVGRET
jgi:hypothetical protein